MRHAAIAFLALIALRDSARAQMSPAQIAEQEAMNSAPGTGRVGNFYQGAGAKGGRSDWNIELEAGKCYWLSGAGGDGVKKLALYLWDPGEKRLADKKSPTPMVMLAHCPVANGLYHVQAKILDGAGPYAMGVYMKGALPSSPPPPTPAARPAFDFTAAIDKQAKAAAPGARPVGELLEGDSGSGDHSDWSSMLEPGHCYWVIGMGEPKKVKELSLYLWGPDNKRITESKSSSNASMIGHCPTQSGMFKIQAKVASGGGAYAVRVYGKSKK